jgi:hypothetical protein
MNREYHNWHSRELYRDMEMLEYGRLLRLCHLGRGQL